MEIKPCPFCGSKDSFVSGHVNDGWKKEITMFVYVSCKKCGASGPSYECISGNLDASMEMAVKGWNDRRNV